MQRWRGAYLLAEVAPQLHPAGFQRGEAGLHIGGADALADRIDQFGDLSLHRLQFPPFCLPAGPMLGNEPVPFRGEGSDERRCQVRVHETVSQDLEHMLLREAPANTFLVAASTLVRTEAAEVVAAQIHEVTATRAAKHLPGEKLPRPPMFPKPIACGPCFPLGLPGGNPGLGPLPKILRDNSQVRHGMHDEGIGITRLQVPCFRVRVLHGPQAVPHHFSDIEAVAQ